jgi:RNA polymerase sigma factor (sigma-70 family)
MRAAQQGDAQAFACLWRDLNPAVIRYLRVVSPADAHDLACESWVTAVRRVPGFTGDETSWRELVFGLARQQAADEKARLDWLFESVPLLADDDLDGEMAAFLSGGVDEPAEPESAERETPEPGGPRSARAQLDTAVEALRALPEAQAEVLALRLAAGLPAPSVAALMGVDVDSVTRAEQDALQALGDESADVAATLQLPFQPEEVADEAAVLTVFTAVLPPPAPRAGQPAVPAPSATVIPLRRAGRLGAGAAAASALVVGIGALSAAAYTGGLPAPVQEVMHRVIGAPAPSESAAPEAATPSSPPQTRSSAPRAGTVAGEHSLSGRSATGLRLPSATTAVTEERLALVVLCTAWDAETSRGGAPETSVQMRPLVVAAGGVAGVPAYCTSLGAPPASTSTETAAPSEPETSTPAAPTTSTPPPTSDTTAPTTPPVTPEETPSTPPVTTEPTPPPTTSEPAPEPSTQPSPEPAPAPTSDDADTSGGKGQGSGGGRDTAPGQSETNPGRGSGSGGGSSQEAGPGTQEATSHGRAKGATATEPVATDAG